jgi:HEPN domain-containing protein
MRARKAKALLKSGFNSGAYYLAGYAVECGLKACIARQTRRHDFPERQRVEKSYSHSLVLLLELARLDAVAEDRAQHDVLFRKNWNLVKTWSEQGRYRMYSSDEADALVEAAANRTHGIVPWIKRYW